MDRKPILPKPVHPKMAGGAGTKSSEAPKPPPKPSSPSPPHSSSSSKKRQPAPTARVLFRGKGPLVMIGGLAVLSFSVYGGYLYTSYLHAVKIEKDKKLYVGFDSPYKRAEALALKKHEDYKDTVEIYEKISGTYDSLVKRSELNTGLLLLRRWLTWGLRGDVLEVSVGTGRNNKYIPVRSCSSITMVDASGHMLDVARKAFQEKYPRYKRVRFVEADASTMTIEPPLPKVPKEDKKHEQQHQQPQQQQEARETGGERRKFDFVIQTMGLCSHKDPVRLLRNIEAHCKEDGKILLMEHGKSKYDWLNTFLNAYAPGHLEKWGCYWNRDIGKILEESGLKIDKIRRYHLGTTWWIEASPRKTTEPATEAEDKNKNDTLAK